MATSREDARPLQRCGWRANGRLRYPATYTTPWDATQLLLGHSKLESTVRYLGVEVDDALILSEQTDL